jgi:hypothetical protein
MSFRGGRSFVEIAAHGVTQTCAELLDVGSLSKNPFAESAGDQSAFGCFFDDKNDLIHLRLLQSETILTITGLRDDCAAAHHRRPIPEI